MDALSLFWMLLVTGAPSPPFDAWVSSDAAWVRAGPSGSAPIVGLVKRGAVLRVASCTPDCGSARGWALLDPRGAVWLAALSSSPRPELADPEPARYRYARVLPGGAPVRAEPSDQGPEVGRLRGGARVALDTPAGAPEGWLRQLGVGWVSASRLNLLQPSAIQGEPDPRLPMAFALQAPPAGVAPFARSVALELNGREVRTEQWTSPRGQVRIAFGRRRPPSVLPEQRWIHIDLSEQVLTAYEGDRPVFATLVSTGDRQHRTRTGRFAIWFKTRHDRMHGEGYDLEEVPLAQYFLNDQALHGAYWSRPFGRAVTHGCVNLSMEDADWLFQWSEPEVPAAWHSVRAVAGMTEGTPLVVEERIPRELAFTSQGGGWGARP